MAAKYQIFVSSTFQDLRTERDAVTKAILEMGHIPVGMEMFSAADEQQWQLIARQIESSDYHVVVLAHRYGSVIGTMSYTEREYEHAIASRVPVLGFIIDESALWPGDRQDSDKSAIAAFKQKVKGKPVSFWKNADDLNARVVVALSKAFHASPRRGWLPADQLVDPAVAAEVSRLSKENAELRRKVESLRGELEAFQSPSELETLDAEFKVHGSAILDGHLTSWESSASWRNLFSRLAPALMQTLDDATVCDKLARILAPPAFGKPKLNQDCFETIRIQLIALGFVSVNELATATQRRALFWSLTKLGHQKMVELRTIRAVSSNLS